MFADVVLPLAVPGAYTYLLPDEMVAKVVIGTRVVVPLGKTKRYTGIVIRLHDNSPGISYKEVEEIVDSRPLLLPLQIDFWRWMANYYMCFPGEVMKAALPSGLKLESETVYALAEGYVYDEETAGDESPRARQILSMLRIKPLRVADLQKEITGTGLMGTLRDLAERGIIEVMERVSQSFKSRTETHIRLAAGYRSEDALQLLCDLLEQSRRTQNQLHALTTYLDISKTAAALTLKNENLVIPVKHSTLLEKAGDGAASAVASLKKKGIFETYNVEVGRLKSHQAIPGLLERPLSEAQQQAKESISEAFRSHDTVLLHGVTSSGKTEVYTKLIEDTLSQGRQVLYLLPEIALTTQITTRLGRVFGDKLGIYHSKFPDNERVELWQRQLSDRPFPLILGVRSAVFLPFRNLGLVIVDEEHETSYKQQDPAPRYNARDAAIVLARLYGAKVLLGTATPSLESYTNALNGKYGLVELTTRYGDVQLPEIKVEDVKELRRKKQMTTPFAPRLMEAVHRSLSEGGQAILFLNRRGYSPQLSCSKCSWTPHCSRCDVALTFHQRINRLVCHYCGTFYDIPACCPQCQNTELRDIGYGTEKIESAVEACFPEARTARMDLDTTRSRSAYEKLIGNFQQGRTNLLVGTQMVTKGLDFDHVNIVGILNADQMLNASDFRAHERAFQMMSQVAGRAGRRGRRGMVVLQTCQPQSPTIQQVVENDYRAMYDMQMQDRRQFRFPPEVHLIAIYFKHRNEDVVQHAAVAMADMLRTYFAEDLLGPDRPNVSRVQMQHIRKILLKTDRRFTSQSIRHTLLAARDQLLKTPAFKGIVVFFDVDPL